MSLNLTQYPSGNCFINKVTEFVMTSTYSVTMTISILNNGVATKIFEGRYHPDFNSQIKVDVTDIVKDRVKTTIPTSGNVYTQGEFSKEFQYRFEEDNGGSETGTFKVYNIASNTSQTFNAWCASHFLTNQATQKETNYEAPEWLTWNDLEGNYILKARFYPNTGGNNDVTVKNDTAVGCYTVNVSYSRIIQMVPILPRQLKGYYDLILFDNSNHELARQRYIFRERSGMEHYYVFANALGGVDTLVAEGANVLQPELSFNYGRFGGEYTPIDDTENTRLWEQSFTIDWRERNWIWEILTMKGEAAMYDAKAKTYSHIVVTDANISIPDFGRVQEVSFEFIMSEAAPMPVILENEERSTGFSQSEADSAEDFEDLTKSAVLPFASDGQGGYETNILNIEATSFFLIFVKSSSSRNVYIYLDGVERGIFNPYTDSSPISVPFGPKQTLQLKTSASDQEPITIQYYGQNLEA